MIKNETLRSYHEKGDIPNIRNVFVGGLSIDPTFADYRDDYEQLKMEICVPHEELTPLVYDKSKWDKNYWASVRKDLSTNFSEERFAHAREIVRVIYPDKVRSLEEKRRKDAEEKAKREAEEKRLAAERAAQEKVVQANPRIAPPPQIKQAAGQSRNTTSVSEENKRREAETAERNRQRAQRQKAISGAVAVAVVILIVVLILLLK